VEDVYVDRERREARLVDVSAGGLPGVGKKHFLVPVENTILVRFGAPARVGNVHEGVF
jgi:hypothetical protein